MDCKKCYERRRADYWHKIAMSLLTLVGGAAGAFIAFGCIKLFCN